MENSTNSSFIEYAIAILPSSEGAQKIQSLNAKLSKQLVPDMLEQKHNKCHITLYHGAYKPEDLSEIASQLGILTREIVNLRLNFENNVVITGSNRYISLNIKSSADKDAVGNNDTIKNDYEAICNLHSKVIDVFNKYHQCPLQREIDNLEFLQEKIKDQDQNAVKYLSQVQKYGVSGVKEMFRPHITLWYQWPRNSALVDAAEILKDDIRNFSCDAWALILGKLGFHGNIEGEEISGFSNYHPYAIFPLGKNFTIEQAKELAANTHLDW